MKVITLKRIVHDTPDGTFGVLVMDDNYPYFTTIELAWKNNQTDISCIPAGEYIANRIVSPSRGYELYELSGVPNRTNVQMHIANTIQDVKGCIGIGSMFGEVETKENGSFHGIRESKTAFNHFMSMMKNDPQFKLIVADC